MDVNAKDLDHAFLSTPGGFLVNRILLQLSQVKAMVQLFGPYKTVKETERATDQQRWADYLRTDWSIRQLPSINVYESGSEAQSSDEGFLTGTVSVRVNWPPSFRRSDLARVPTVFKGVLQNFFSSKYAADLLDEHYSVQRPAKVPGLNEIGKTLTWQPNTEGVVDSELVPVTILDVGYRIDLRAWHRELERQGRTKADPFDVTMKALAGIAVEIDGVEQADPAKVDVTVGLEIDLNTP